MKKSWWKNWLKQRHKNPINNRKKVGVILFWVTIGVFLLFAVRLFYIVVVGKVGDTSLGEKTQALYQGTSTIKAKRGTIYDRDGNPIAQDATSYSVTASLDKKYTGIGNKELFVHAKDKERIAEVLHQYLGMTKDYALKQLSSKSLWVEFGNDGKNISLETKNKIEKALKKESITGIYFNEHPARIYPNGNFASYFIGYADYVDKNDDTKGLEGKMGLEKSYDKKLKGTDGKEIYQKDSRGNKIPGTTVVEKKAKNGADVYTTLNTNLQQLLETKMDEVNQAYNPENMTAMLVEAKTGDILAESQRPTYNPETKDGLGGTDGTWTNYPVQDSFEPGSTMKIFTVASAIEQGVFNKNATFESGTIKIADTSINDWEQGRGTMTYAQALAFSSNVGMVHLQQMMTAEWPGYLKKFHFGQSTNFILDGETKGSLPTNNVVDQAMSAYGQAISVTNLQMVQGFTAIANEGKMMKPNLISKIKTTNKTTTVQPTEVSQPIKASTAKEVLDLMKGVVEDADYGTGYGMLNIDGYSVSAKTGTAQYIENGKYTQDKYISSVVQIVPTENPKYIMYITIKNIRNNPDEKSGTAIMASISNPVLKRALDIDASKNQ